MKVAMINGSPKLGKSNSEFMLKSLETLLLSKHEITQYNISKKMPTSKQYIELCHVDVLVFAFPLYIDAIPSHLFQMLIALECYLKKEMKNNIFVYTIINNGFFEGHQNHIAIQIIENWCKRCGLCFGQGIGQGAGEMIGFTKDVPLGKGSLQNLGNAMNILSNNILEQNAGKPMLFNPNFPYLAWRYCAHFFWHLQAKQNGLKRKDILNQISSK